MKDLGLRISNKGDFGPQVTAVRKACLKKCHWISHTFRNKSTLFPKFIYSTHIRSTLDYGSQVWAPTKLGEIDSLESILKVWTKKCTAIKHFHHWERLKILGLSSVQWRMEHYQIIYLWKLYNWKVPPISGVSRRWSAYKGWIATIPKLSKNKSV